MIYKCEDVQRWWYGRADARARCHVTCREWHVCLCFCWQKVTRAIIIHKLQLFVAKRIDLRRAQRQGRLSTTETEAIDCRRLVSLVAFVMLCQCLHIGTFRESRQGPAQKLIEAAGGQEGGLQTRPDQTLSCFSNFHGHSYSGSILSSGQASTLLLLPEVDFPAQAQRCSSDNSWQCWVLIQSMILLLSAKIVNMMHCLIRNTSLSGPCKHGNE